MSEIDSHRILKGRFIFHIIDFVFGFFESEFKRRQFFIKLAFAAIFHNSQGQTLRKMIIDFRANFSSPRQVHIALSRDKKSQKVPLVHKKEDDPVNAGIYHSLSAIVKNPVPIEAVQFV